MCEVRGGKLAFGGGEICGMRQVSDERCDVGGERHELTGEWWGMRGDMRDVEVEGVR